MATYDESTAQCFVYSYNDGLLSKLGHDLEHRATRFMLHIEERKVLAEIDARSLRVVCARRHGRSVQDALTDEQKREIEAQMAQSVLRADAYPLIRFRSTSVLGAGAELKIHGLLQLNNYIRPVATVARRVNGHYEAEVTIHQPAFGIHPFSALQGALRVKPDVTVRIVVPVQ